jgi:hypothetical protein
MVNLRMVNVHGVPEKNITERGQPTIGYPENFNLNLRMFNQRLQMVKKRIATLSKVHLRMFSLKNVNTRIVKGTLA